MQLVQRAPVLGEVDPLDLLLFCEEHKVGVVARNKLDLHVCIRVDVCVRFRLDKLLDLRVAIQLSSGARLDDRVRPRRVLSGRERRREEEAEARHEVS